MAPPSKFSNAKLQKLLHLLQPNKKGEKKGGERRGRKEGKKGRRERRGIKEGDGGYEDRERNRERELRRRELSRIEVIGGRLEGKRTTEGESNALDKTQTSCKLA